LRERLGGEWQWTLNLAVHEVGSVLLNPLESLGWGYRRILRKVGRIFCVIPGLRWKMVPRLDLGMSNAVQVWP
jgi:hypothetical protein